MQEMLRMVSSDLGVGQGAQASASPAFTKSAALLGLQLADELPLLSLFRACEDSVFVAYCQRPLARVW
jgi:hypothetical protein